MREITNSRLPLLYTSTLGSIVRDSTQKSDKFSLPDLPRPYQTGCRYELENFQTVF